MSSLSLRIDSRDEDEELVISPSGHRLQAVEVTNPSQALVAIHGTHATGEPQAEQSMTVVGMVVHDVYGSAQQAIQHKIQPNSTKIRGTSRNLRVKAKLCDGTWSAVYTVEDLDRGHALSVLKITPVLGAMVKSMLADVQQLRAMDHDNVLRLQDQFRFSIHGIRCFCIRTEYCANGSLEQMIVQKKAAGQAFDKALIRQFLEQLASALAYIHEKGGLHGDLRPANVLCTAALQLKVHGFGYRDRLQRSGAAPLSATGGCPAHAPPESTTTEYFHGSALSAAYDMWSLGCTLGELTTLRLLWPADADLPGMVHCVGNVHHGAFLPMVRRLLTFDADARPTAQEVLRDLKPLPRALDRSRYCFKEVCEALRSPKSRSRLSST